MYLILVIGHTGQGKTTWVREFIKGKKVYAFDVNNEYPYPVDTCNPPYPDQIRNVDLEVERFLSISERLNNYNIIFEDATGFFRGRQSPLLIKQIVKKRHSKNNFIILFHSINRVPPELLEMANHVILFKTNDNLKAIDSKFKNDKINDAFAKLFNAPKYSNIVIEMI